LTYFLIDFVLRRLSSFFDTEADKWVSLEHTQCQKLIKAFEEEMTAKENDPNNSLSF
jgi:hemerythrin-like domain-containing protein